MLLVEAHAASTGRKAKFVERCSQPLLNFDHLFMKSMIGLPAMGNNVLGMCLVRDHSRLAYPADNCFHSSLALRMTCYCQDTLLSRVAQAQFSFCRGRFPVAHSSNYSYLAYSTLSVWSVTLTLPGRSKCRARGSTAKRQEKHIRF